MENQGKNLVNVNGVEYEIDSLSDPAKLALSHLADLDTKIAGADFQRQQLQICRNAFFDILQAELQKKEVEEFTQAE